MSKQLNLSGQRFGRLVAIEPAERQGRYTTWLCKCDCGKETVVRTINLRSGNSKSCGCLSRDTAQNSHIVHGGKGTRLYRIWAGIKARCECPGCSNYKNYGGRGIKICREWRYDFAAFRDWALSHGYQDDLTIDRIDNDKGYSPDNCRWATMKEQQNHRRNNAIRQVSADAKLT